MRTLRLEEYVWIDFCLPQDCPQRPLWHVTRMIGHGRIAIRVRIEPDLMAARRLPVKGEAAGSELSHDLPIPESSKPPHLSGNDDRKIVSLARRWQIRHPFTLTTSLDEPTCDISGDVECFGYRAALGDKTGQLIRSSEVDAVGQFLDLNPDRQFHTPNPTIEAIPGLTKTMRPGNGSVGRLNEDCRRQCEYLFFALEHGLILHFDPMFELQSSCVTGDEMRTGRRTKRTCVATYHGDNLVAWAGGHWD